MSELAKNLESLFSEYWEHVLEFSPQIAQQVGDSRHARTLAKESMGDYTARYESAKTLLAKVNAVDVSLLEKGDVQNHAMMARELGNIVADFELSAHLRPGVYPFSPPMLAAYLLQQSSVLSVQDGLEYVDRLGQVSNFIDDHIERYREGFKIGYTLPDCLIAPLTKDAEARVNAPAESCEEIRVLLAKTEQRFEDVRAKALEVIKDKVKPAQQRWLEFVRNEFANQTTDSLAASDQPDGERYYQHRIRMETASDLTPDEIHQLGISEVERIAGAMEEVIKQAGFDGNLKAFQEHLKNDKSLVAESAEALKAQIEQLSMRINRRIPEFFGRLPRMTYGVESIPEAAAPGLPPAYAQPNPPNGKTSGIHWITSLPEKAPRYMHIPLALHEAWPGHLMHIALLQEQEHLPAFRRYGALNYISYIEGWALYCERLGHDMGLYDDPLDAYGHLDMEMWRACRLVVDTGIHYKSWTRDQAITFLRDRTSLPEATIESEVDRYIGLPAQALSYKIGELKIRELRERAETTLGDNFSLRELHDQLIGCGAVAMDVLDNHIQEWLSVA
ncbi:DUF885 family protein [Litorivivens sp.]|uniref:DUF885 domain-containing protein n=1 Tax=Litorivivens sp. TaxID=2020868 RepID=UPI00356AD9A0